MLTRRASLLLPLLLVGCGGGGGEHTFPPLRYDYLTPLQLNVASIQIEQRFVPSGAAPDASMDAPVPPLQALRAMAEDRLKAVGTSGQAVFVIQDASLVRHGDTISTHLSVELDIDTAPSTHAAFAQASVSASSAAISMICRPGCTT